MIRLHRDCDSRWVTDSALKVIRADCRAVKVVYKTHICQVPIKVLERIANASVVNSACKFESCTWRSCDDKSFLYEVQLFTPIVEKVKWYRISIYGWYGLGVRSVRVRCRKSG